MRSQQLRAPEEGKGKEEKREGGRKGGEWGEGGEGRMKGRRRGGKERGRRGVKEKGGKEEKKGGEKGRRSQALATQNIKPGELMNLHLPDQQSS